jgi:phthiodiolone/phenolphthiodiolone dimycocerosates ketoreductase
MSIVPAMCLPVLTGRTRGEVDEALESELVKVAALNASDEFFAQHGAQHPLGVGFTGAQDLLPQDWDEQTALSYLKDIPSSLVRDMALVGTASEVVEQAAVWRDCGVRHAVLLHCSFMQRSLRNGLAAMGPFLKIIRGLKKL